MEAKNGNEKAIVGALLEIDFFSDKGKLVEQAVKDYESEIQQVIDGVYAGILRISTAFMT